MARKPHEATREELDWLDQLCEVNGYHAPQALPDGRYAVLSRFMFTCAILTGWLGDDMGYEDRWCFNSFVAAAQALVEWREKGFEGEPEGWHRHPDSGRRRPAGHKGSEYINP